MDVGLEEGEVVAGDFGHVEVGGLGQSASIVPLPAGVVRDYGFGMGGGLSCGGGGDG